MPLIKLKHVVSFSSEDTSHPTSNLLKPENYRKWRSAEPGEKQAVVVLEFEKATKIHNIDIGNNGSALIEVLVGRSSDSSDNFKVILVTSSFMTPAESKSFTNTNRVRMFGPDKLSKPVADEKWDRVKVVCTQPFNKYERYGLSFVTLHSPPEDPSIEDKDTIPTPKRLGSFTLRDEEEDAITPGSLFLKKKMASPPAASTAALVRDASSSSSNDKTSVGDTFRNRQPVASKLKEEKKPMPVKQVSKPVKQDTKPVKPDRPAKPVAPAAEVTTKRKHGMTSEEKSSKSASSSRSSPPPKRKKTSTQPSANVPFHQILKGVVFVLSGFKNPKRGDLRDKAQELGAQYKPDWMSGCTHLICAFSNTPKYNQVKGRGKIVTEKWIKECYRKKRKLPTRNFHLPGDTSSTDLEESTEEEEEEEEEPKKPSTSQKTQHSSPPSKDESKSDKVSKSSPSKESKSTEETKNQQKGGPSIPKKKGIIYDESTDDEMEKEDLPTKEESASEQDTEDELEKIHQTERKGNGRNENDDDDDDDDIYNKSTEDEEEEEEEEATDVQSGPESGSEGLPELPDFLSHKHFLLYGEMDQPTRRSLIRYITAYNGILEEYMSETVDFVLTDEKWDQNFEDALSENASLAFVRPKWIFTCHEKLKLVPFQPYIITPS